jgi:hypothetical protein
MDTIGKLTVSAVLAQKLGLPIAKHIPVRVGNIVVTTQLIIRDMENSSYLLSNELAEALFVKKGKTLKFDMIAIASTFI